MPFMESQINPMTIETSYHEHDLQVENVASITTRWQIACDYIIADGWPRWSYIMTIYQRPTIIACGLGYKQVNKIDETLMTMSQNYTLAFESLHLFKAIR